MRRLAAAQFGDAVPQHLDLLHLFAATLQFPTLLALRNQSRSHAAKPCLNGRVGIETR